jgi:hypothetical protein
MLGPPKTKDVYGKFDDLDGAKTKNQPYVRRTVLRGTLVGRGVPIPFDTTTVYIILSSTAPLLLSSLFNWSLPRVEYRITRLF